MKKNYIFKMFIALSVLLLPMTVDAMSKTEAEAVLNNLKGLKENADGTCTYYTGTVDYSKLQERHCSYTYEEYADKYKDAEWFQEESEENRKQWYEEEVNRCKQNMVMFANDFTYLNLDDATDRMDVLYNKDTNEVTIKKGYVEPYTDPDTGYHYSEYHFTVEKTCKAEFAKVDEKELKKANKVADSFKEEYTLYGLDAITSFYHYGSLGVDFQKPMLTLARFADIKKIMMRNPEYNFVLNNYGLGASPFLVGKDGYLLIIKDNIVYDAIYVGFGFNLLFPVDKDETGTVYEKAEKRIKDHLGKDVKITFDIDNAEIIENEEEFNSIANAAFGVKDGKYKFYDVSFKIEGSMAEEDRITIVEVDKKMLDKYQVRAEDSKSKVNIYSESAEVPGDATINVEDVKDKNYVDKATKDSKRSVLGAYDIELIKYISGDKITEIEKGVDVFMPIKDRKVGDKLDVYHIKEDGTKGDKYVGEVVEVDGELFVKFTTTHFSTFAVLGEEEKVESNPNTSVYGKILTYSIIAGGISLGLMILSNKTRVLKYEKY